MKSVMKMNRITATMTKNSKWLCASCDRIVDASDTVIDKDKILCTFCAITEHGYYAKPEEHLPDEYYLWLQERDENGLPESF
jgi:hypothetical protein